MVFFAQHMEQEASTKEAAAATQEETNTQEVISFQETCKLMMKLVFCYQN